MVAYADIEKYIPGTVDLAEEEFDGIIAVTAYVEAETVKTVMLSEKDIAVENLPEGFEAQITAYEEEFPVYIKGLAADIDSIDINQLRAYVDINALLESGAIEEVAEGYYDVKLALNLPENVSLRENITVRLNIKEK